MPFKLRNQSPLKQGVSTSFNKPNSNVQSNGQSSLKASNNKVTKIKEAKKGKPNFGNFYDDLDAMHPMAKAAVQIVDPTGVSSYRDVNKAWSDKKFTADDIIEPIGAIPVVGKFGKMAINLSKAVRGAKVFKEAKASKAIRGTRKASDAQTAAGAASTSPLHKQKLSPLAAKKKAARDLAYAKTDDRRIKKAHSQRMHRKNPGNKGKDYDHEDGRFESVKQNRGNEGEGTKKESGKKYKLK
jgi:hypothetical protein